MHNKSIAPTQIGSAHVWDPLRSWAIRLGNIERRHLHAKRQMRLELATSAGLALATLERVPDALNPPVRDYDPQAEEPVIAEDILRWINSGEYSLFELVDGERLDQVDRSIVDEIVVELRHGVERLHEEMRRRFGALRSPSRPRWTLQAALRVARSRAPG